MEAARAQQQAVPADVKRYNLFEVVLHWLTFASFLICLGTGLAFAYPRLFWLTNFFGGPQTSREVHPWAGIAFAVGLLLMLLLWGLDELPAAGDMQWWRRLGAYVSLGDAYHENGRFNAGQKLYFWVMLLAGVGLFASGLLLWQRDWSGAEARSWMRLVHNVAFVGSFGFLMLHVYMSVAMYPGTLGAMLHGRVTRGWALLHHARWYRKKYGLQ